MADKKNYNDDYQFADLDSPNLDPFENPSEEQSVESPQSAALKNNNNNNVLRNAVIAMIVFVLAVLAYKFFSTKKIEPALDTAPAVLTPTVQAPLPAVQPQIISAPAPKNAELEALEQKINAVDANQQNLRSDVSNLNNQLSGISNNISDISAQMTKLSQSIETLSATVNQQSNAIAVLEMRLEKPKPVVKHRTQPPRIIAPIFYIQAVVPGRAWIISTRGSTLTVREGSSIPGYGIVKLIDAQQGRILTGSGRVIKFSQDDS